ncbi:Hypothetical predicted protein [Pelobates cultripes]|uniref:Uncharacterized protein n=1 Tax=Pelobates cultripes TaxID=61616 RepID=A0AAD1SFT8_PELCU|nr:Hypothetical predicted protein [Pelobates cultripes]
MWLYPITLIPTILSHPPSTLMLLLHGLCFGHILLSQQPDYVPFPDSTILFRVDIYGALAGYDKMLHTQAAKDRVMTKTTYKQAKIGMANIGPTKICEPHSKHAQGAFLMQPHIMQF